MNKNLIAIIALFIVPISGLGIDIYVPSLPSMQAFFHTSSYTVSQSVMIYLIGYGISQFISGPIIDSYGTRNTTIYPLILFMLLSIAIALSSNIAMVLWLRFFQGMAVGFFATSQRVIIVHLFSENKQKLHHMLTYSQIAWSMGPIIAPAIGGYLEHALNWQANFGFLAIYSGVLTILVYKFSPETLVHKEILNAKNVLTSYRRFLSNISFNLSMVCMALVYVITLIFNTVGSFVIQSHLHYSPVIFGYCALALGTAYMVGNMGNRVLKTDLKHKVNLGTRIALIISVLSLIIATFVTNIWVIVIPTVLITFCGGLIFGSFFIYCVALYPKEAGKASGLMATGFIIISSGLGSVFSDILPTDKILPILFSYLGLLIIIFLANKVIFKKMTL